MSHAKLNGVGSNGAPTQAAATTMKDLPILLVADSTLQARAEQMFEQHGIRNVKAIRDPVDDFARPKHETPDARHQRREALRRAKNDLGELILSRPWAAIVSHYQEFLFLPEHLAQTTLPLNIHPSCPEIPGMGYDVLPLIPGSATYGTQGATLHFMTRGIDEGDVIRVLPHPIGPDDDYSIVRPRNQELCMQQLQWLCEQIADAANPERLERYLRNIVRDQMVKWGTYVNAVQRDALLFDLHADDPNHPALRGNKKFEKAVAWKEAKLLSNAEPSRSEMPADVVTAFA